MCPCAAFCSPPQWSTRKQRLYMDLIILRNEVILIACVCAPRHAAQLLIAAHSVQIRC
jgi:hypothetical protein